MEINPDTLVFRHLSLSNKVLMTLFSLLLTFRLLFILPNLKLNMLYKHRACLVLQLFITIHFHAKPVLYAGQGQSFGVWICWIPSAVAHPRQNFNPSFNLGLPPLPFRQWQLCLYACSTAGNSNPGSVIVVVC